MTRAEPTWFTIGKRQPIDTDFMEDRDRACINWGHTFYSDDLSDQAIAKKICSTCPVFRECTLWAIFSPDCDTRFGIVAGMDPPQRRRIRRGDETFRDWTETFNYIEASSKARYRERAKQNRHQRRNHETNLPAVSRQDPG
jgi:hypothetical protein